MLVEEGEDLCTSSWSVDTACLMLPIGKCDGYLSKWLNIWDGKNLGLCKTWIARNSGGCCMHNI